jgi:hypothetical protein
VYRLLELIASREDEYGDRKGGEEGTPATESENVMN